MLSKEEEVWREEGSGRNEKDDLISIATQKYLKRRLVNIISPCGEKKKATKRPAAFFTTNFIRARRDKGGRNVVE